MSPEGNIGTDRKGGGRQDSSELADVGEYGFPTGIHARIERDRLHEQIFSRGVADVVVIDMDHLVGLDQGRISAQDYLSRDVSVASTTTIDDESLHDLHRVYEREVVKRVQPRFHIGFDVPVYKQGDMEREVRLTNIENYLKGIHQLTRDLEDTRTTVIPLLKGTCREEFHRCYHGFRGEPGIKEILDGSFAFYAGQYFGPEVGCRIKQLEQHLWQMDTVCEPNGIFLIGFGSPDQLPRFPGSVVSIAGLRHWVDETNLRNVSVDESCRRFTQLRQAGESNLGMGTRQLTLDSSARA